MENQYENSDKEFAQGIYVQLPKQDFILAEFGFKISEFLPWFQEKVASANANGEEFINIQFKNSKANKPYAEVNNWKPKQTGDSPPPPSADINDPF